MALRGHQKEPTQAVVGGPPKQQAQYVEAICSNALSLLKRRFNRLIHLTRSPCSRRAGSSTLLTNPEIQIPDVLGVLNSVSFGLSLGFGSDFI